ncbi:unnamed protein product [Musa hybrid cultivar]
MALSRNTLCILLQKESQCPLGWPLEIAGVVLSLDPKPIQVSSLDFPFNFHLQKGRMFDNFSSTKSMRNDGGIDVIKKEIEKLGLRHKEHIAGYGEGNEIRFNRSP